MILDPQLARARFERDIAPLRVTADAFIDVGLRPIQFAFPVLEVALTWTVLNREIILHVDAADYDYRPIKGWWVDSNSKPLRKGSQSIPNGLGFQIGSDPYGEDRPWFCFRGWREYHDHEGHQNVPWASIRAKQEYRMLGLIQQLRSDLNRPEVVLV